MHTIKIVFSVHSISKSKKKTVLLFLLILEMASNEIIVYTEKQIFAYSQVIWSAPLLYRQMLGLFTVQPNSNNEHKITNRMVVNHFYIKWS